MKTAINRNKIRAKKGDVKLGYHGRYKDWERTLADRRFVIGSPSFSNRLVWIFFRLSDFLSSSEKPEKQLHQY